MLKKDATIRATDASTSAEDADASMSARNTTMSATKSAKGAQRREHEHPGRDDKDATTSAKAVDQ